MDKPIGEPKIVGKYKEDAYWIERVVKDNGDIVWFGLNTNWVKEPNKEWKYLGTDETVKPIEAGGDLYPEGRHIWIECEPPIYEKLYLELF